LHFLLQRYLLEGDGDAFSRIGLYNKSFGTVGFYMAWTVDDI